MTDSWSSGIDAFKKKLESVVPDQIAFGDLFSPTFMKRHTKSTDIDAFFTEGGFHAESQAELETISETDLDAWVRSQSSFQSWGDMKVKAYEEWAKKKMR